VTLYLGRCEEVLPGLPANSVDAIVTDPPAGVSFMGRTWDGNLGGRDKWVGWLSGCMAEALRVLKPGGHALVWSLPRTSHWTAWALEDAGFDVRDCVMHLFGSGFPKSLDVSKAIDKTQRGGMVRAKLLHFAEARGINGRWLEERGVASAASFTDWTTGGHVPSDRNWRIVKVALEVSDEEEAAFEREVIGHGRAKGTRSAIGPVGIGVEDYDVTAAATEDAARWEGFGTALKPGQEMWWLARKPLGGRTVAANVLEYGTGALNIAACKVGSEARTNNAGGSSSLQRVSRVEAGYRPTVTTSEGQASEVTGRWPANIVLTHSASDDPGGECVSDSDGADCARLLSSVLGSLESCPSCLHFCDGQAHRALEAARELPQLQRGVSVVGCSSLAGTLERILRNLQTPRPMPDAADPCATPANMPASRTAPGRRRAGEPGKAAGTACTGSPERQRSALRGSTPASSTTSPSGSCGRADHSACRAEAVARLLDLASVTIVYESCPVAELDRQSGVRTSGKLLPHHADNGKAAGTLGAFAGASGRESYGDTGGSSRFYPTFKYQAKAPASERPRLDDGTAHECVKSLGLMSWLVRLITPPGGTVLDMFAGSGPVGEVAVIEGFRAVLIEQDPKSAELIKTRLRKPIQPVMFGMEDAS